MLWTVRDTPIDLSQLVLMGILNTDPLSFSGDGCCTTQAIARGKAMLTTGACILDIGGASTRPGATETPPETEWERITEVISVLSSDNLVSVDTTRPSVARRALSEGVHIINDISGGASPELLRLVAESRAGYVLMRNLRLVPELDPDPIHDLELFFKRELERLTTLGIRPEQVVLDPGIGYGRSAHTTITILQRLKELVEKVSRPILVGASRKGFMGTITGALQASERLPDSLAVALAALEAGVQILRVHDVAETDQAIRMWRAIRPRA